MNLQAVLQKTEKGMDEMETRRHKLEQKLRTILIVVNGKATGAELVQKFEPIGDVTPLLEQLLAGGFIREAPGRASRRSWPGRSSFSASAASTAGRPAAFFPAWPPESPCTSCCAAPRRRRRRRSWAAWVAPAGGCTPTRSWARTSIF